MICPRCNGHAISARDQHGAYVRCMICGHEQQDAEPAEYQSRHEAHHATDSRIPINIKQPTLRLGPRLRRPQPLTANP